MALKQLLLIILCALLGAACSRPSHEAQGYLEGRYTYLSSSVSGDLTAWYVERGAYVKAGEKLLTINARPEQDDFAKAEEDLKQAAAARDAIAANLGYDKLAYERNQSLVSKKAIQLSELDRSRATYQATAAQLEEANARIKASQATMERAKWVLEQKIMYAPVDAIVYDTYYRVGERTIANQPVIALLAPSDISVIFYVPETALGSIHLNKSIRIQCDGCKENYEGRISYISPSAEYTPPVIFSNETTAKLIFRVEAAFKPEIAAKLHPGQPVRVNYAS